MLFVGYLLAVVIGLLLGLLGGGGSILTVPVLVYILMLPMKTAVPMSLVVVGLTSAVGVWSHHRRKNIRWDAALAFAPGAIVGAMIGARLAPLVPGRVQLSMFAVVMIVAAVAMFLGNERIVAGRAESTAGVPAPRPLIAMGLLGAAIGLLTGLVGVGGGFLYVPALVLVGGIAMKEAVGTSLALIVTSCAAGLVGYLGVITIEWGLTAAFAGLAIVGVLVGSRVATRAPQRVLRQGFAGFLVIMGIMVLLRAR